MHTGIFHKGGNGQFRNQDVLAIFLRIDLIRKALPEAIFLQGQVRFNKRQLTLNGIGIRGPIHVLAHHYGQFLYHIGGFFFFFQDAVHTDAFQCVEQKMGIDLAV